MMTTTTTIMMTMMMTKTTTTMMIMMIACRSCHCQQTRQLSYSDFLNVGGGTSSSRDDADDDTDECANFERLPKYFPQPSTSVLPRSRSEFERLNQRHPSRNPVLLSCCYRKQSTSQESCTCVTPGQSSSKLVDTWSGELQPLSPYEVVRIGRGRRSGSYEVWRLEDILSNRKVLAIVTLLVAFLGALTGLAVGLMLLEQVNSRGSQGRIWLRLQRSQPPIICYNPSKRLSLSL